MNKIKVNIQEEYDPPYTIEHHLNSVYDVYVLAKDESLTKNAQKLKEAYRIVLNNLKLFNVISIEGEEDE